MGIFLGVECGADRETRGESVVFVKTTFCGGMLFPITHLPHSLSPPSRARARMGGRKVRKKKSPGRARPPAAPAPRPAASASPPLAYNMTDRHLSERKDQQEG